MTADDNHHDAALLFEQARAGRFSPACLQWLSDACRQYDLNDGQLPLERCLQLPSRAQRRRLQRDYHLVKAAELVQGDSCGQRAAALGREIDRYMRGEWRQWSHRADPPPGVSDLRERLHYLAHTLSGRPRPDDKRIEQILRGALEKKSG